MSERHLHIVSFNIPYPPDYGGVIDVYYKLKAFRDLGVKVHLHCFQYGREESQILEEMCHKVHYYPRTRFYQTFYSSVPYIVGSRQSGDLLSCLVQDNHPILFEGLHTCFYLTHPSLKDRIRAVRMHNIEWDYYRSLGKAERSFFRKFYFYAESMKLKSFEKLLAHATHIFAISPLDAEYLKERFENVFYMPAFHRNEEVTSLTGKGKYIIYHGNLSVVENNQAAIYLVQKVFKGLDVPVVIAGKKPLNSLKQVIKQTPNVELREDIPFDEMLDLITNAHINVLVTFQQTGIKLKLLNSLFNGRFCLVNTSMVKDTGLESLCLVEDNAEEMRKKIRDLMNRNFEMKDISQRIKVLMAGFSNQANAKLFVDQIYRTDSDSTAS